MERKYLFFSGGLIAITTTLIGLAFFTAQNDLPLVAIANYGPHASLEATIIGVKAALARQGFVEGKTVRYATADVGFDMALIPQMLMQLKGKQPAVLVVLSTPVAQCAKGMITNIPVVFTAVTDPVAAGLIETETNSFGNITGSAERQDMGAVLGFARSLLPALRRIGLLYATGESNDLALVEMMRKAGKVVGIEVVAVAVDQARNVPACMQQFKDAIDVLYVGSSGAIQPTLPVIAGIADKLGIPVLNVDQAAARDGLVLASFGVDFESVGAHAGRLVARLLAGEPVSSLVPCYPALGDHKGVVNRTRAAKCGLTIPGEYAHNVTLVG